MVSVSDSESSYRNVQSWNQTQNRVLDIASLRTGIGTGFQDRIVSEPESELKKLELGISAVQYTTCKREFGQLNSL